MYVLKIGRCFLTKHVMVMQMFLVQDIIRGGDWQVVLQKEPHAK
jgi:hypothetical protein